jgi:hypothetical protein
MRVMLVVVEKYPERNHSVLHDGYFESLPGVMASMYLKR